MVRKYYNSTVLEDILFGIEILLLIWIVVQGEIIVRCERGVYRLYKEREDERRKWRLEKQEQQRKKIALATSDSKVNTASPSPTAVPGKPSKAESAQSAEDR